MKKVIFILLFIFMNIKSIGELSPEIEAQLKETCENSPLSAARNGKWDKIKSKCICPEGFIFYTKSGCKLPERSKSTNIYKFINDLE